MSARSALAARLLEAWDGGRQITPPSETEPGFDLARGYAVAAEIAAARTARGERIIGRKIGFTNRNLWPLYGVDGPIWGWMYAHTVADIPADGRIPLPTQPEPRIEPEIAFGFRATPAPGMSAEEIAA
ncbi:MAG: hydratase, partial [Alphaproteobacteria bacterium]